MFTREVSLFRNIVPFKFFAAGPVAEISRRAFERYPHTFETMLERLEEVDTNAYPKMLLAEAMQALVSGSVQQRDVRRMLFDAEEELREEAAGKYDADRAFIDPEYKLNTMQLMLGAGWWARLLMVGHEPWVEAETYLHLGYGSDVRRDETISQYTRLMLDQAGREKITDDIDDLYKALFLLERDLYGPLRFDKRGDQVFLMQSVKLSEVGRNDESAEAILGNSIPSVKAYGNFNIRLEPIQDRWKQYTVICKPEMEPPPWSELIEVPEARVAAPNNLRIAPTPDVPVKLSAAPTPTMAAGDPSEDETAARRESTEFLDAGFVKVHFDTPLIPRRTTHNENFFKFELAVINPEVGFLPRKVGKEYGV